MSTVATQTPSSRPVISHENLLIDYPEADVILRSRDSYEFHVLKLFIVHSSPILEEKVLVSHSPPPEPASTIPVESDVDSEHAALANAFQVPVVQLPIDGAILFSLLTYIFPIPPVLPSSIEQIMELLSVAQMYKMDVVLTHIRNHIAQQEPPFIREETAFLIYSLSQKHGLQFETLQAAQCTLSFATLTIDGLAQENKLDMMPGAFLYELWKYHQRVRSNLTMDLKEFQKSFVLANVSKCYSLTGSGLPHWLDYYISQIGADNSPVSLEPTNFYEKLIIHVQELGFGCEYCGKIPQEDMCAIGNALNVVVHNSIVKAESDFVFPIEGTGSEGQARQTRETSFLRKYSNMPNADVILQSSDLVDFYVHRSVLIVSSPFFRDMFSLPQPPNGAVPNALPVVHLSEDAETLDSLISMLYPVPPEIPSSSDDVLALLAAAAKYDMDAVQSSIRVEINQRRLLASTPALFRLYAIAYSKGLIPEMENSARLTLTHPLTFESLGDTLRLFEGRALRDLADFRLRSIRDFKSNLMKSIFESYEGASKIWGGCSCVPSWLEKFKHEIEELSGPILEHSLTNTIPTEAQLREKYLNALWDHVKKWDCKTCLRVHTLEGEKYFEELKDVLARVRNVPILMLEG